MLQPDDWCGHFPWHDRGRVTHDTHHKLSTLYILCKSVIDGLYISGTVKLKRVTYVYQETCQLVCFRMEFMLSQYNLANKHPISTHTSTPLRYAYI